MSRVLVACMAIGLVPVQAHAQKIDLSKLWSLVASDESPGDGKQAAPFAPPTRSVAFEGGSAANPNAALAAAIKDLADATRSGNREVLAAIQNLKTNFDCCGGPPQRAPAPPQAATPARVAPVVQAAPVLLPQATPAPAVNYQTVNVPQTVTETVMVPTQRQRTVMRQEVVAVPRTEVRYQAQYVAPEPRVEYRTRYVEREPVRYRTEYVKSEPSCGCDAPVNYSSAYPPQRTGSKKECRILGGLFSKTVTDY